MKKQFIRNYRLIVILSLFVFTPFQVLQARDFYSAISYVESKDDDKAVGDKGKAVGRFQIWKIYVDDVNRISGKNFTYEDRWDAVKSKEMVVIYITHYAKRYERLTGKKATDEIRARIHNGGPNGWKKSATLKYWDKVKKAMEE